MYSDPSADLCLLYDSFSEPEPINVSSETSQNIKWYIGGTSETIIPKIVTIPISSNPRPMFCDEARYIALQKVKDSYGHQKFEEARNATNPFERIKNSIFMNRAAIKLANIDAVHHITKEIFTFDKMQSSSPFSFCDIAAGPGGFTQYIQFRYPDSIGYGMTLKHETLDWNKSLLKMENFKTFYGEDDTGDLYTHWLDFCNFVTNDPKLRGDGVDLVTADGGFDLEYGESSNELLKKQEFLSSRLLLVQSLVGIICTKIGGNFVLKCFDTVTKISSQIIFILSLCFEKILIFKPISSRPANSERYIICKSRLSSISDYVNLLKNAAQTYSSNLYIDSLFSNELPATYINWLTNTNNISINLQIETAKNIIAYISGKKVNLKSYDQDKFLIIWNLPDKPLSKKNLVRLTF